MDSKHEDVKIRKLPHHDPKGPCLTRLPYRQGKKLTAVKVYTVNDESQHLIIRGVPTLNLCNELRSLCLRYGSVKVLHVVSNYSDDEEQFTEVYHIQFVRIQSARFAKHMMDNKSYFGGILKVSYAPELETLAETRLKLKNRRREIAKRVNKILECDTMNLESKNQMTEAKTEMLSLEPSTKLLQGNASTYDYLKSDSWVQGGLKNVSLVPCSGNYDTHIRQSHKCENIASSNITDKNTTSVNRTNISTENNSPDCFLPRSLTFPAKRPKIIVQKRKVNK